MVLPKDLPADLWDLVDTEMAAICERLGAVERVIEQLNKHGIQHPGTGTGDIAQSPCWNAQELRDVAHGVQALGGIPADEQRLASHIRLLSSWLSESVRGGDRSTSEGETSFSSIPLSSASAGTSGAVATQHSEPSPDREAWWLGDNYRAVEDDAMTSSDVSTPRSFGSEGSSFYSSEASCESEPDKYRRRGAREVPRRHWLSPLYRRRKETEIAAGEIMSSGAEWSMPAVECARA